jgi:hypothetical protein
MNRVEKNVIVAKFMGYKEQTDPTERWFGLFYKPNYGWISERELSFDSDWNNLMELRDKLQLVDDSRYQIDITNSCKVYEDGNLIINNDSIELPIKQVVFDSCFELVQRLNDEDDLLHSDSNYYRDRN